MSGFAGSGKTFLSIKLLNIVEDDQTCWTVVAPTHKAVNVLRNALNDFGLKPTWNPSTIHRLLRLKLKRKGDLEICEETKQTENSLDNLGLVLIDEASMIDSNLLNILLKSAYKFKTRLVFVGDPAQLPPIGEAISPLFSITKAHKAHLNEVVRHQGPILKLASILRQEKFICCPPKCFSPITNNKGSVGCLDNFSWLKKAQDALKSGAKDNDPDAARILCYTNRFLERLIPHARRAIHGEEADKMFILPGEVLITRRAVMIQASIDQVKSIYEPGMLFGSNEEIVVKDVAPHTCDLLESDLLSNLLDSAPLIKTLLVNVICKNMEFSIRVLPELGSDSRNILDAFLDKLCFIARESTSSKSRKLWKAFFHIRDSFASVGPASVLTVHRSQGSTFRDVFIASDVFWPKDMNLRKQLVYVAISRASNAVWFLETKGANANNNLIESIKLIHNHK